MSSFIGRKWLRRLADDEVMIEKLSHHGPTKSHCVRVYWKQNDTGIDDWLFPETNIVPTLGVRYAVFMSTLEDMTKAYVARGYRVVETP